MNDSHNDIFSTTIDRTTNPFVIFWPGTKDVAEPHVFYVISDWRNFLSKLALNRQVPMIVAQKFDRARRLYFLSWFDMDIIKAGELAALMALELALRDVYPSVYNRRNKNGRLIHAYLKDGLKHMVENDGLKDEALPTYKKCPGAVISNLYREEGDQTGTLVGTRNSLAHGDPFDALPRSGLLEVVRDLIDYMYRNNPESHE
ncbi:MAG: hypothetical protein H6936_15955 [Burkholderiales bacterium]|nr:hypothetical protein [Nitrosomonas sp.]MCP5276306.1 hypothetical protein [Burkholderiales bacterium]